MRLSACIRRRADFTSSAQCGILPADGNEVMKQWQETLLILRRMQELLGEGRRAVLAVTAAVEGSSYRGPGAMVLIEDDGSMSGNVTGGCLEQDLKERALTLLEAGRCGTVSYDTGGEEDRIWGLGVGCEGVIHLFLRPFPLAGDEKVIRRCLQWLENGEEFILALVKEEGALQGRLLAARPAEEPGIPDGPLRSIACGLSRDFNRYRCGETRVEGMALVLVRVPQPWRLIVFGAGDDTIPLVRYATDAGFRVYVVDHRSAYLSPERFPAAEKLICARYDGTLPLAIDSRTLAVVKTRLFEHDRGWVLRLAKKSLRYIGLLGPAHRRDRICQGLDEKERGRIFGPVGLDIGAVGPEQIAISIVAELLAVLSGSPGGHARDKKDRLHSHRQAGQMAGTSDECKDT